MAARLSMQVPRPSAAYPHELYFAPPVIMSRPLSMQPSIVADAMGTGTRRLPVYSVRTPIV